MPQTQVASPIRELNLLFALSGAAGLIYQVCWQRLLFAAFGSDLTSVTIVVSAFMAGLGFGALAGGALADRWPQRALSIFAICESLIGLFGLASTSILLWAGTRFVGASMPVVAGVNFLLVLMPALLMGATLPVLVCHVARLWRHVGRATGQLYAVNTLGAAIGALLPTFVMLNHMRLDSVIQFAGSINLGVAALAWWRLRGER